MRARVCVLVWLLTACAVTPGSSASTTKRGSSERAKPGLLGQNRAQAQPARGPTELQASKNVERLPLAAASAPLDPTSELLGFASSRSSSLGGPSRGRLRGGVALPDSGPGYYHNTRRPTGARFGTVETLQAIVRAAAVVHRELPGSALAVNDIGLLEGGPIAQHGSHQAGRDADILFYVLDAKGAPAPSVGVPIDPKGVGWDFKDLAIAGDDQKLRIDLARTWRFLQALFEVAPDQLQRIFVVEHVRSMLLAEAERVRAPAPIRQRFEEVTCQPGAPHDDHLHVRFFCTPEDMSEGCMDSQPVYPWRAAVLRGLGLEPALLDPRRTSDERYATAKRTTTPAEAKKRAGRMHAKVVRFLAERNAWIKQPHPGRPYCR